jgi:membrane protein YdbS with pleckstrin-like domain
MKTNDPKNGKEILLQEIEQIVENMRINKIQQEFSEKARKMSKLMFYFIWTIGVVCLLLLFTRQDDHITVYLLVILCALVAYVVVWAIKNITLPCNAKIREYETRKIPISYI